jgi:hypothetical protein
VDSEKEICKWEPKVELAETEKLEGSELIEEVSKGNVNDKSV